MGEVESEPRSDLSYLHPRFFLSTTCGLWEEGRQEGQQRTDSSVTEPWKDLPIITSGSLEISLPSTSSYLPNSVTLLSQPFPGTVFHAQPLAENAFVHPGWWPAIRHQPQKLRERAGLPLPTAKVFLNLCLWTLKPLAVMSSAGKSPSQTEHYTYQNEFFSCDFPLDQVSAEPRIRTRAETERSMPGHFPWSLDNQLWGGGGKRGEEFNQSRPHEGFPKHSHVENPTLLLIGVKFLLPLFDHISSGEDHKLWEVWPWIYQCRLNWVGCTEGFITGFFPLLYMLGKVPSLKG